MANQGKETTLHAEHSPLWSNPLCQGILVGRKSKTRGVVWMPSAYTPKKMYPFKPMQIRFLHAYASGESIPDICVQLGITVEEAQRLLNKGKCKEYLGELATMDAEFIARSAKTRVAHEMLDVWDGKTQKTKQQVEVGKEFWGRVWPKNELGGVSEGLNININLNKVAEAFKRQEVIEAENLTPSENSEPIRSNQEA